MYKRYSESKIKGSFPKSPIQNPPVRIPFPHNQTKRRVQKGRNSLNEYYHPHPSIQGGIKKGTWVPFIKR